MKKNGYEIVLTGDRTIMSDYKGSLFLGFITCGPKTMIKPFFLFRFVVTDIESDKDGRVKAAPYGLRKIEGALLENGFTEEQVVTAKPKDLKKVIGPNTKIIGINTMDPLGRGPASSTFAGPGGLVNKDSYLAWKFRELVTNPLLRKYGSKIVVGGAGAWQLQRDVDARRELGIDVVFVGEAEKTVPEIFRKILNGEPVPEVVEEQLVEVNEMPKIHHAAIGGLVEIARGCGRGCDFCIPTMRKLRSTCRRRVTI
ncbi:MAG: hypothetical protein ACTSPL_06805 [Candidatus Odinarchaeia archaeon]